ncbi:hypothetical protein [Marinobacter nauticus]|uniref:hypothetical protein n=1 Tax=Marinobacter nauticus TaxID=2743 RepID=UPI001C995C6D|nr:hypothetical protein [Marinobacter nauticus]MBY5938921.1 hypothetical protein [Marinobacter nauticus]MBY5956150.1 hypothetical protein [Marinobacter nauticus]MBY6009941.1 hypothetical protein [Marinobacter nauticus]
MSLGKNVDDEEFGRREILSEAAYQMVVNNLSEFEAISRSEELISGREQAAASGLAEMNADGAVVGFAESELNSKEPTKDQANQVKKLYSRLCEKEGLEPE